MEEEPDVVRMNEQPNVEEWMLEGVQSDYSKCSYDQFGYCRQQVFVCRTCRDQHDRLLRQHHPEYQESQIQSVFNKYYNDIRVLLETSDSFVLDEIVDFEFDKVYVAAITVVYLGEEHFLDETTYKLNVLNDYSNLCCNKLKELYKQKIFGNLEPFYIQVSQAERNLESKHD